MSVGSFSMLTSLQSSIFLCERDAGLLRNLLDVLHELVVHVLHDREDIQESLSLGDLSLELSQVLRVDVIVPVMLDDLGERSVRSR